MDSVSRISAGAYATDDSASEANTGSAMRLGSNVCCSRSDRNGRPTSSRLSSEVGLATTVKPRTDAHAPRAPDGAQREDRSLRGPQSQAKSHRAARGPQLARTAVASQVTPRSARTAACEDRSRKPSHTVYRQRWSPRGRRLNARAETRRKSV